MSVFEANTKICNKCKIEKEHISFVQRNGKPTTTCKNCKKIYDAEYRLKNSEKIKRKYENIKNTEEFKIKNRKRIKEWKLANRDKFLESKKRRRKLETEWMKNFYKKKKKDQDIEWLLKDRIRKRMSGLVRSRSKKTIELLGCAPSELRKYLESKFKKGMSWDNYGVFGWHIDHIKPLSKFDLKIEEELKKACHYTNLQPLWAFENLSKGAK